MRDQRKIPLPAIAVVDDHMGPAPKKRGLMRWLRRSRWVSIALISLTVFVYLALLEWALPLLWPYRDHALVNILLDLISGGHLPDILHEIGLPI